jgi:asparagine synthase (glutamine-hydrolysing)
MEDRLRNELEESVRLRMRSDVPLGAFLSGGIDSAVIAGLMQRQSDYPIKTYTIGFPVSQFDETPLARKTAEHLQTEHHEHYVQPDSLAILPRLIWHYDEPYGDSSAIPTYYVSKVTREHVKVALTGDGGDELFGGYPRYKTVRRVGYLDRAPFVSRLAANCLASCLPAPNRQRSLLRRLQSRIKLMKVAPSRRYASWVTYYDRDIRGNLFTPEFSEALGVDDAEDFFIAAIDRCNLSCAGTRAMVADLQTYLPCDLLTKVDIASMAHGLECRSPFLDHKIVELALSIPYAYKIRRGTSKWILKRVFGDLMPPAIISAKKRGFSIPLDHWFRNEHYAYLREVLLDSSTLRRGFFRQAAVEALIQEHYSGRWNHGERLWALLYFELWHRMFIDSINLPAEPPNTGPIAGSNSTISKFAATASHL